LREECGSAWGRIFVLRQRVALLVNRSIAEIRARLLGLGLIIILLSATLLTVRFSIVGPAGIVDDLYIYFASSRWVVEGGRLYRDFPSEYPLLANLWFAIPRGIAAFLNGGIRSYSIAYVLVAALVYSIHYYVSASSLELERPRSEIIAVLLSAMSPVLVQLVLLRFDFLLVILIFNALFALKRRRIWQASLLVGLAIATKGYPLVYCLAMAAYIGRSENLRSALIALCIMAMPSLIFLGITWAFAGFDGMMSPFLFHARRQFDSDSVYQLFALLWSAESVNWAMGLGVKFGAAALAVLGAIFVREGFASLARIMALQTFGLLFLSPITSPQFVLWALPIMYFVADVRLSAIYCGFALFSNFWLVREFGLPENANQIFWITNLGFRFWMVVEAGMSSISPRALNGRRA